MLCNLCYYSGTWARYGKCRGREHPRAQALGAYQHILQKFENMFIKEILIKIWLFGGKR